MSNDNPLEVCKRCDHTMPIRDNPTGYCGNCAQEMLPELLEGMGQIAKKLEMLYVYAHGTIDSASTRSV